MSFRACEFLIYKFSGWCDSYQFINPKEVVSVTRTTINKNIYKIENGDYSDRTGLNFNPAEKVINVDRNGTYTVNSGIFKDEEYYWLSELFLSENIYVELPNPNDINLIPVIVKDTSNEIKRQKWNRSEPNNIQVNYTFTGDFIPGKVIAYGSGVGSSQTK